MSRVSKIGFLLQVLFLSISYFLSYGQTVMLPGSGVNFYPNTSYFAASAQQYAANDSLYSIYNNTKCGLNYTSSSLVIGKKMAVYGMPYYGVDQPAPINVVNIGTGAKIEKAYAWWDLTGNDTIGNVIIKNPNQVTDTFPGILIGKGFKCWGPSSAFRADVTSIISGNGTYTISGLPTDTTFTLNDVNGITLFIIYSDSLANYAGHLYIHDGYMRALNDTIYESINNLNVNNNYNGKAFMLVADFQNQPGNTLKMNNGPFLGVVQDYWDFEEKNTVYINGQTSSTFGVSSPNDCSNLLCIGAYYQEPYNLTIPGISQNLDTLTSSPAASYQWVFNGVTINGANSPIHIAQNSGNYSVIVSYTNSLCYISSATFSVTTCQDKIKPNINVNNDTLWTDSVNYSLQWFYNGNPIAGAVNPIYAATLVGNYWVKVTDTTGGCSAVSDTIFNSYAGIKQDYSNFTKASIIPNPNSGDFILNFNSAYTGKLNVAILNLNGELVFGNEFYISQGEFKIPISIKPSQGIYMLKIITTDSVCVRKVIIN